jgi:uncharacterized protein YdcH (DUF465 family)
MPQTDALREELLRTDDEFRRLHDEHQAAEKRLEDLYHLSLPSQDDEIEEKKIKLHKLALKDRMEQVVREHRENLVAV